MSFPYSLYSADELPDNVLRYSGNHGHVESYFLKANHPTRPLAVWIKSTVLAPLHGPAVAESWFIWFDGERGTTLAHKDTQPFSRATFKVDATRNISIDAAGHTFDFRANGASRGTFSTPAGRARFELSWRKDESPIAVPMSVLPWRFLREGRFPRAKPLTPFPSLFVSGKVEFPGGATQTLESWPGMQGRNWGREHTFEYAWGQCVFPDDDAVLEGFTTRVRFAGITTPRLSGLVVRRGARTYRFDRIFDPWRQRAEVSQNKWVLGLRSADGEVTMVMDASQRPMVCLGYDNPDGHRSYCINSKLAEVTVKLRPSDGASFTIHSPHGGALEFLRREPDPRFTEVV